MKISIGIVSYKDKHYLEHCLKSLREQTFQDFEILIFDNASDETLPKWLEQHFSEVKLFCENANLGFGKAHNFLINKSRGEFYLCLNSDIFCARDFLQELLNAAQSDSKIAAVSGKLLSWKNFPANPLAQSQFIIDTLGIEMTKSFHAYDIGQAMAEKEFEINEGSVFGVSGAAAFYRISALKEISYKGNQAFDELFFMYKEDVDLSCRLNLAGYKSYIAPRAVAFHDRTVARNNGFLSALRERKARSAMVRENSFLNQLFVNYKFFLRGFSWATKLKIIARTLVYAFFLLIFDTRTLKVLRNLQHAKPELKSKKAQTVFKISAAEFERLLK
jgi:GT2 family glycosyltransferase